ncbi:MAG: T9SS type A sorting domain-containing protein [Bacteroidia bacterium]
MKPKSSWWPAIAAFLLSTSSTWGQNLLTNPSFETNTGCPSFVGQPNLATGWNNPAGHSGSADYIHTCGTNAWVQVPSNAFGTQAARTGNAYMGFALFYQSTPEFREYVYNQLTPVGGLTPGQNYTVSWYVSAGDNSSRATNSLQFYFSATAPTWGAGNWNAMTTYVPQCSIPPATYISNKTAWVQVSASFTASGGERYMTMGNFRPDATTSTIANGAGAYDTGYVYYEDGVVQPTIVLAATLHELRANREGDKVRLDWETLSETANDRFEIERSAGDYNHFEKIGTLTGAGTSSERHAYTHLDAGATPGVMNYYRLRVVDQNGDATYSNAVGVETQPEGEHVVNFFPNPVLSGQSVEFTFSLDKAQSIDARLIDIQGREVRTERFDGVVGTNRLQFSTQDIRPGQYLLNIHSGAAQTTSRIQVL